jgi:hypothetical protein
LGRLAAADPLQEVPQASAVRWGGGDDEVGAASFVAEAALLGVVGAEEDTTYPDGGYVLKGNEPALARGRVGIWGALRCVPLVGFLRMDFAEATRDGFGDRRIFADVSQLIDDLWVRWSPARAAELQLGRAKVPFSKLRQFEEADDPFGTVPFVVAGAAPDRRWGLTYLGDLGSVSYAAGAYTDFRALEPGGEADGAMLLATHVEWTPLAPMYGSNPPGKVLGARGPLPTPRTDPWFRTLRVSAGFGALVHVPREGSAQLDASMSVHAKWGWASAIVEVLLVDASDVRLWGELSVTPIDRVNVSARAEWQDGVQTGWVSIGYHATKSRRNKIAFVGWLRRGDVGDEADGAVVLIQASL